MDVFSAHEIIFVKSKFLEHRSFNVIIFFSDSIQNNHDLLIMEKTGTYRLNFFSQAASKLNKGIFNRFFKICRLIFGHIPFSEFNAQWLESCASKSCYMDMGVIEPSDRVLTNFFPKNRSMVLIRTIRRRRVNSQICYFEDNFSPF